MQILFASSVLCSLGTLWAAIALARHLKAGQRQNLSIVPSLSDYEHYLLAVSEPAQELAPPSRPAAPRAVVAPVVSVLRTRHADLHQSDRDVAVNRQWTLPTHAIRRPRVTARAAQPAKGAPSPNSVLRKPARHGTMKLLDPTCFNQDPGDLTAPRSTSAQHRQRQKETRHITPAVLAVLKGTAACNPHSATLSLSRSLRSLSTTLCPPAWPSP